MSIYSRMTVLSAFVFALSGCSPANVNPGYSLDHAKASGHGLVLGTMTVESPNGYSEVEFDVYFNDSTQPGAGGQMRLDTYSGCNMQHFGEVILGNICGKVLSVDLPAGDYYITKWEIRVGQAIYYPTVWNPVKFTVEPGQAVYIGNLDLKLAEEVNSIFSNNNVVGGWPVVQDEGQRDLSVIERLYPHVRADDIKPGVLRFPQPGDLGASSVPIYIPIFTHH